MNLVEDKPKRKFMNPKGKKFKKPNRFHSSPPANFSSFKPSQSSSSNPKPLTRRLIEDSAMSAKERMTWRLNVSTGRKNLSKLNQEKMEEIADTRST